MTNIPPDQPRIVKPLPPIPPKKTIPPKKPETTEKIIELDAIKTPVVEKDLRKSKFTKGIDTLKNLGGKVYTAEKKPVESTFSIPIEKMESSHGIHKDLSLNDAKEMLRQSVNMTSQNAALYRSEGGKTYVTRLQYKPGGNHIEHNDRIDHQRFDYKTTESLFKEMKQTGTGFNWINPPGWLPPLPTYEPKSSNKQVELPDEFPQPPNF